MTYCGRFAPSPTGLLHFGSLVAAVGSWLCARRAGGRWLVRIDDIDPPREMPGAAAAIITTLAAHGLVADAPVLFQSSRAAAYDDALEQLRAAGNVFPCWCSRSDLHHAGGLHRDGRCTATRNAERPPAWRVRVTELEVRFDDGLQGPQRQNLREQAGDFVVRRVEGLYAYQLACAVDDAFQGVTEVVRGYDLLESTPRQIWLQQLLGLPTPAYLHLPIATDAQGRKLSKSERARPVDPADPMPGLRRAMAFLGVPVARQTGDPAAALAAAIARFDPATLPRCPSRCIA